MEDLAPLCAILARLGPPEAVISGRDPREWLEKDVAEQVRVYDMAPVHVAPTKNVVGHLQIYSPTGASPTPSLPECADQPASELLAVGKLFVKPQAHDYGVARHLLKEARRYIQAQGKTPVLDLHANVYLTAAFCGKYGFAGLRSENPTVTPMIYAGG